ncbi:MAG: M3 family metallopeptidase, partial [Patescibacteria group bacterium]
SKKKSQAPEKNTGAENFRWDLKCMYRGVDEPQIDLDIAALVEMIKNFYAAHKGRLGETLSQAITDYANISMLESKVFVYLFLKQSTNVGDAVVKSKIADAKIKLSRASGEYLTFFDIELVALSEEMLAKLYKNYPVVAKYRPWIEHTRIFKPHLLSESVESALTKRSPFGSGSWSEFFDELESDLKFKFQGKNKTLTEMLDLLTESKDAKERARLLKIINLGLGGMFAKYSAQNLYMVVGSKVVEIRERSYKHPMESRNKSNQIPDAVVDALHRAVEDVAGPLARRYYRLKAAHLGLKKLRWSDRNAPMPFSDTTIVPFKEALKIVVDAYQSFSPTLAKLIRKSIKNKRIDAPAGKGRRDGAYNCSIVLPGNIPTSFTFLNYLGSGGDVMTLAHELGHGVHGLLAGQAQGPLMCHAPTAYAETASVFGEMTTYNFLKKRLTAEKNNEALLALIMSKID